MGNHNQNSEAKIQCWKVQNHNQNSAPIVRLRCSQDQNSTAMIRKMFWQRTNLIHKAQYLTVYSNLCHFRRSSKTPCTAIRREQHHHLNSAFKGKDAIILPDGDWDVISFCIYFYLPSLDTFFSFLKIWDFLALFNSEIGAVLTKSEHLAGMHNINL